MKNLLIAVFGLVLFSCSIPKSSLPTYDLNRFEKEIVAFEEFDKTARYRPDAVVFTGSSSIRLWSSLGGDMSPIPSINRGFGGSTIPEVNHYYDRIITKFRPSIIVLYAGENDLWMGRSVADVVADYRTFVKKTKSALPGTKVVFLSMKPSPARWEKWKMYQAGNQRIQTITAKDPDLYFIDISKTMLDDNGKPMQSIFVQDMLHMNATGYEGWQKTVFPAIDKIYKK